MLEYLSQHISIHMVLINKMYVKVSKIKNERETTPMVSGCLARLYASALGLVARAQRVLLRVKWPVYMLTAGQEKNYLWQKRNFDKNLN